MGNNLIYKKNNIMWLNVININSIYIINNNIELINLIKIYKKIELPKIQNSIRTKLFYFPINIYTLN